MAQNKLTVVITADTTQFEKQMRVVSNRLKSAGKDLQSFGQSITKVTGFLTAKGAAAMNAAMKVQDAFKTIQTGTGATGKTLKGLQDEFKELARSVPESYQEVPMAIADLNTMLGLSGGQLWEMGKAMLDVTRLAGGDLKGNIASVAKAMNAWQVDAVAGTAAVNDLYIVSQNTGAGIADLSALMAQNSDILRLLGYNYQTATVLLGQFEHEGVNTKKAMSGLRTAAAQLVASGVKDVAGGFQSIANAVKNAATETQATSIAMKVFGKEGGSVLAAAIRSGALSTEELTAKLAELSEQLAKDAQSSQTFKQKISQMFNDIGMSMLPAGEALISLAEEYVMPLAKAFLSLSPAMTKSTVAVAALVAAIGPISWVVGGVVTKFSIFVKYGSKLFGILSSGAATFTEFVAGAMAAKGAMLGLNGAMAISSGGLFLALTVVAGLAAAVYSTAKSFGELDEAADLSASHVDNLKGRINDVKEAVLSLSQTSWDLKIQDAQAQVQTLSNELAGLQERQRSALASYALRGRSGDRVSTPYDDQIKQRLAALETVKNNKLTLEQASQYKAIYNQMQEELSRFKAATSVKGVDFVSLKDSSYKKMSQLLGQLKGTAFEGDTQLKAIQAQLTNYKPNMPPDVNKPTRTMAVDDTAERLRWQNSNGFLSDADYLKILQNRLAAQTGGKSSGSWNKEARSTYDELQRLMKDSSMKSDELLRWQNNAGFLSNSDYSSLLQSRLADQTKGLNWKDWSADARSTFDELQRVIGEQAAPAMDTLKDRFASGQITAGEYQAQLQALMDQYTQFPGVTEKIKAAMDGAKKKTLTFAEGMKAAIDDAKEAVEGLSVTMGTGLADSFARAVAYGENLGDSLKKLGQDIVYTVTKMWMLQSVTSMFSGFLGGGAGGGGTSFIPLAGWVADGITAANGRAFYLGGSLVPFATGGIVSQPTLFKFARGTGLMGEAGPEAIMPLQRDSRGRLGISAEGVAPGGVYAPTVNVTVNNDGGEAMSEDQADQLGHQLREIVDARVSEQLYRYRRTGYFRNSGAFA